MAEARALGVDYVALCADMPDARAGSGTLRSDLLAGRRIDGVEEVPMPAGTAIRVWRVLPAR
jgi:hypothetical protein